MSWLTTNCVIIGIGVPVVSLAGLYGLRIFAKIIANEMYEPLDELEAELRARGDERQPCPACSGTLDGIIDAEGICEACGWRVQ